MKKILGLLMFSFFALSLSAGDEGMAKQLLSRKMIVKMLAEDPEVIERLEKKDPAAISSYKANIKASNDLLKANFNKHWKHHSSALFLTAAEIEDLKATEKEKKKKMRTSYAVLSLDFFSEFKKRTREESARLTDEKYTGDGTYLFLRFWEGTEIIYTSLPHIIPNEADMVYGMKYLTNQVEGMLYGRDITDLCKENGPQIRNKTLLVTSWQLSQIKQKDLLKSYPYPYKVVSKNEIEKAIISGDKRYAAIISTDQSDTVVMKTLILTGTGQFAGYVTAILRNPLNKKELKELAKFAK